MLAPTHRLRTPAQFRAATRRGSARRVHGSMVVVQLRERDVTDPGPTRVGFVVSKAVGNAVTRNRVKRVLRHAISDFLPQLGPDRDLVIRALPASHVAMTTSGAAALRADPSAAVTRVTNAHLSQVRS